MSMKALSRPVFGSAAVMLLLAASSAMLASSADAAEKLRVGKAVPEAFSFVPLDIGIQEGIFRQERPRDRIDRLRRRRPHAAGDGVRQSRHRARFRPRDGVHRQGLADQGRGSHGRTAAVAGDRRAAGRSQDRRRSQGQEDQRIDRRLADILAGERNVAAAGLGAERHRDRAHGGDAGTDRGDQARRHRRDHHGYRKCL